MAASQEKTADLHLLLPDDGYYAEYLDVIYLIGSAGVADGAVYYSAGMLANEIAVLLLNEGEDTGGAKKTLERYIERRKAAFTGYAPEQAAILETGKVVVRGNYVALIICEDVAKAQSAFVRCFSDDPPDIPEADGSVPQTGTDEAPGPSTEPSPTAEAAASPGLTGITTPSTNTNAQQGGGSYNPEEILAAWRSGDASGLSDKNKSILIKCTEIINDLIYDGMSDYEKELAIHDWIIDWAAYDAEANNNAPDARPDPDNDNPYGLLLNRKAICTGYTLTFQLFMDLLGIECITVHGISTTGGEHAWNMVRIDGEWYCVDVTWNDPVGEAGSSSRELQHKYFNVPSQLLRDVGHIWDESSTPEATAPKLFY